MQTLLQMSLAGGGMVLTTALLRYFLRDRLPRAAYLCLWSAALIRLLSPVMFCSQLSIFGLLRPRTAAQAVITAPLSAAAPPDGTVRWVSWAFWLFGALACALWFAFRELRARHALKNAQPVDSQTAHELLTQLGIRRRVRIRTHARACSPMTYGILRPVVVLPEAEMANASLHFALLHELCHIKRCDCLLKLCAAAAACMHWFNPCAWLLLAMLDRDLEIACDQQVLRRCAGDRRAEYAHTLLDFAGQTLSAAPLASHLNQTPLEERIIMMMNSRKTSIAGIALATALVLGTTSAFAASPKEDPVSPLAEPTSSVALDGDTTLEGTAAYSVTISESSDASSSDIMIAYEDGEEIRLTPSDTEPQDDGSYLYTLPDGSECRVYLAEVSPSAESK